MSIVWVDSSMLTEFVEDCDVFNKSVDEHFRMLDGDEDGVISIDDLQRRSGRYGSSEYELQSKEEIANIYKILFEKFDTDRKGILDQEEFRLLMREIMLAKARGIGESPVLVALQGDGFVKRAVDYSLVKKV